MINATESIRSKIAAFVTEIESLTRQAALEAVQAALGGGAPVAAPARAARRAAPSAKPKPAPRAKGGKRTPEQVAADAEKILAFVKSNPGCRSEQIQSGLGLSKKDIQLPIIRLREERKLKTTGQKRGTKYFAGGAGPKAAAPKAKPVAAKKRKAMSPEQKAALLERLAKARAARAAKKG